MTNMEYLYTIGKSEAVKLDLFDGELSMDLFNEPIVDVMGTSRDQLESYKKQFPFRYRTLLRLHNNYRTALYENCFNAEKNWSSRWCIKDTNLDDRTLYDDNPVKIDADDKNALRIAWDLFLNDKSETNPDFLEWRKANCEQYVRIVMQLNMYKNAVQKENDLLGVI